MLREFHRVTRGSVIVSLRVAGNYKAWKRKRLEKWRSEQAGGNPSGNRFVVAKATIEAEFRDAGFDIVGHDDFIPAYAMWRLYVLLKRSV